ncbi:MAG: hypothetical protein FWF72_05015, partial [Paludibacter sp.]|nr:hypothetical protein [Paludibacter sp.]
MKRKIIIVCVLIVIVFLMFFKQNTKIYIGNYNWKSIDFVLQIDSTEIVKDSLFCSPYQSNLYFKNLKYGFHKISIKSNEAQITQTENIFLLPFQFICIEFWGADSIMVYFDVNSNKVVIENVKKDLILK